MHGVMNTTKWNELWAAMCTLHPRPRWRTREVDSGYVSDWDRDWFYHFRASSFRTIEWVEITTDTPLSAPVRQNRVTQNPCACR
ncbi:DUF6678 family protein [Vibrio coralliilyticus]|uniref:DUF6678 family protein n=1 Tax=Vibrio coralliilyticus TaxID=190893 RepID=UPI0011811333|nr:DUF6678 family protein [Vibrio coralliilyticus]